MACRTPNTADKNATVKNAAKSTASPLAGRPITHKYTIGQHAEISPAAAPGVIGAQAAVVKYAAGHSAPMACGCIVGQGTLV